MTAQRFSLLPARYAERVAERRDAVVAAAALLALVGLLAVASLVQGHQLRQAESKRDVERIRHAELQARRRALAPFRQLSDGILGRERLLTAAMETEVSWSRVLSSVSATFPADASLTSLTAESSLPAFGAVRPPNPVDESRVIGSSTFNGYSVETFTPGVERLLQLLEAVTGLSEPRLQEGAVEKIGARQVTNFEGTTFVDGAALSDRYAAGLPAEHDVAVPRTGGGGSAPAPRSAVTPRAPR